MSPGRAESNAILRSWCAPILGTVLSIGSSSDDDGTGTSYREYFRSADCYLTSEPAGNCDLRLDVRAMPSIADDSIDAIFCSGVLEHVDDCHAAVRECWRVLGYGCIFLVGVPFAQPLHRVPHDFWRFTEHGVRYLLRAFAIDELRAIGPDPISPTAYWVRARKA